MLLIFINYRRADAYAAALLDRGVSKHTGQNSIFRASRSIPPGADYEQAILNAVESCDVMLVIIGPSWSAEFARRENQSANDWTRQEIAEGLKRAKFIVPILLTGSSIPSEAELPSDISSIVLRQYLRFDYRNIDQDLAHVVTELRRILPRRSFLERILKRTPRVRGRYRQ